MPTVIAGTAEQVVADAGATTPYAQAAALRDYFWANYVYDLDVDPRDDTNAIANFISEKRGFCVQFASTYAVMARSLGIPSRVAVGFTPGDLRDGVFHVQSHNAHAWPEIWLAGLGWTHLFDPTPPAGSSGVTAGGSLLPGDETIAPPVTPGVVTTLPAPPTSTPTGGTGTPTTAITSAPVPPLVTTTAPGGDSQPWLIVVAILAAIVAAVLIYVAVVINAKSRRRARRRDAVEPTVAVQGAWDEALDKLREAHVPPDPALTPLELAAQCPAARGHRRHAPAAQPGAVRTPSFATEPDRRRPPTPSAPGTRSTSSTARSNKGSRDANGGVAASTRRHSVQARVVRDHGPRPARSGSDR